MNLRVPSNSGNSWIHYCCDLEATQIREKNRPIYVTTSYFFNKCHDEAWLGKHYTRRSATLFSALYMDAPGSSEMSGTFYQVTWGPFPTRSNIRQISITPLAVKLSHQIFTLLPIPHLFYIIPTFQGTCNLQHKTNTCPNPPFRAKIRRLLSPPQNAYMITTDNLWLRLYIKVTNPYVPIKILTSN